MTDRLNSWVSSANSAETEFPLNNLPYGVFSSVDRSCHCGVAIGDQILDVTTVADAFDIPANVFASGAWNDFMELGSKTWESFRAALMDRLAEGADARLELEPHLVAQAEVQLHMPFTVTEFTDFYSGRHHATNVGTMFRGAGNALPPNWLHIPIGYNGRASSIVISGTDVQRPMGQLKGPNDVLPYFGPSARFDFELELGAIVGTPSNGPISVDQADANIFGYVLLNDWSARDIQAWEYQPLGPFQAKATATTISPWIVTTAALAPFRVHAPERKFELLDHIKDSGPMLFDIALEVDLTTATGKQATISRTNYREMYYSSAQQLAHHTSCRCPMRTGDLLGSGTISGPDKGSHGSMLELSWGGKEPLSLGHGIFRSFIEDGDTISMRGHAIGSGYLIGFGHCAGTILSA
ncbi:MAG: fumarylacetoacetase [Aestuariivita sp.]|nr:fumarylacetoacetase [Aestuariivita sp.]MCY4202250.1 fumarylacetoacetase [Aestuariivita sp.]